MGRGHVVSWLFVDMSGFELFCVLGVLSNSIMISFVLSKVSIITFQKLLIILERKFSPFMFS